MDIKVLGPGCSKCNVLVATAERAAAELGVKVKVTKVTDMGEILKHDILMTPGLMINGQVMASGRVVSKDEIKTWIEAENK